MTPQHGQAAVWDQDAGEWQLVTDLCLQRWAQEIAKLEHDCANGVDGGSGGSYAGSPCPLDGPGMALTNAHNALKRAWALLHEAPVDKDGKKC
jgi:hypothetical protein